MISLIELLKEMSLPKNKWLPIPDNEIKQYEEEILNLIKTAYKPIGGNPNFKSPNDVSTQGADYEVINLDDDDDIEAVNITKQRPGGTKSVAMGHDGTKPAKRAVIGRKIEKLKQKGFYVEASGRMAEILIGQGIAIVKDPDVISKVLKGKKIEMNDDGTYQREIGGQVHTKILLGKPNITENLSPIQENEGRVSDILTDYYNLNPYITHLVDHKKNSIYFSLITGGDRNHALEALKHLDKYLNDNSLTLNISLENHGSRLKPAYVVRVKR